MNTLKKLLCTFLAATFVVAALASCADKPDDNPSDTQKPAVSGDEFQKFDFPKGDYKKKDIKFLYYGDSAVDFHDQYIWSENFQGGAIGDAVIERNQAVEDQYNVVITAEEVPDDWVVNEARTRMQAGQCDFDIIYDWGIRLKYIALEGLLYDFYELPNTNYDRSYWIPKSVESLTVLDRLYVATNMVTMNAISWSGLYYFNKMLMDKLQYPYPYDYVYTDSWTYDIVIQMAMGADDDLDGNGRWDGEDQYSGLEGLSLLKGLCNDEQIKDNKDGTYTLVSYTERMVAQYNKYGKSLKTLRALDTKVYDEKFDENRFSSGYAARRWFSFGEDHFLFLTGSLDMTKEFVDMKSDYGIVPEPVVESGDAYKSSIDYCAPMFGIPFQVEDPAMVGQVFDYMAYKSEELLLPAYYETTIKTKRMEDTRDYDMIDIIRDAIGYDWAGVYMWDLGYTGLKDKMLAAGNFGSVAKKWTAKYQAEIDEVLNTIAGLE